MAAVDSDVTPNPRGGQFELLETLDYDNGAIDIVNRALQVPPWATHAKFVIDITITGTTPLFDFVIYGANLANGRYGATLETTDIFLLGGVTAAITQLTTDGSSPIITIDLGPDLTLDTTGSATADCGYAWPVVLPAQLIYRYTMDTTTADEDYNGTISVYWRA